MPAEAAKPAPTQFELKQAYEAELLVGGAAAEPCLPACFCSPSVPLHYPPLRHHPICCLPCSACLPCLLCVLCFAVCCCRPT